ncbi:MAG: hypothetical protein DRP59_12380 [Spirochaetes bacterium]|nr:MAG: hypothetical protein DRP59_12380 [Spirochaetota bacterium]
MEKRLKNVAGNTENIFCYHYVHSYVRGNWRNTEESSPLILAKSSHDPDLLQWFAGSRPVWISSTSSRSIFTELSLRNDLSHEGILKALQSGPCGGCVYRCDKDGFCCT